MKHIIQSIETSNRRRVHSEIKMHFLTPGLYGWQLHRFRTHMVCITVISYSYLNTQRTLQFQPLHIKAVVYIVSCIQSGVKQINFAAESDCRHSFYFSGCSIEDSVELIMAKIRILTYRFLDKPILRHTFYEIPVVFVVDCQSHFSPGDFGHVYGNVPTAKSKHNHWVLIT